MSHKVTSYKLLDSTKIVLRAAIDIGRPFTYGELAEAVFVRHPEDPRFSARGFESTFPDTKKIANYLYHKSTGLLTYGLLAREDRTKYRVTVFGKQVMQTTDMQIRNKDVIEVLVRTTQSSPAFLQWQQRDTNKVTVRDLMDFWITARKLSGFDNIEAVSNWCRTVQQHQPNPGKYYTLLAKELREFVEFFIWVESNHRSAFYLEEPPCEHSTQD